MRDLNTLTYHPTSTRMAEIMQSRIGTSDEHYFQCLVAYYFGKVATCMRVTVETPGGQIIPANVYAFLFAPSGFGKGRAQNMIEEETIHLFQQRLVEETMPQVAEDNIYSEGVRRAQRAGEDPDEEVQRLRAALNNSGPYSFGFDSGSTPAMKQLRYYCQLAKIGSLNLEIDEIGANLLGSTEILTSYLEMYDIGKIKNKLTKNSDTNRRGLDLKNLVPANLLAFGTPAKTFDGGKVEEEFNTQCDQGYARRPLFAFVQHDKRQARTAAEELAAMKDTAASDYLEQLSMRFEKLADPMHYERKIVMEDNVSLIWVEYKNNCIERAQYLPEHASIQRAELENRFFKTLKIATAYAFIDGDFNITEDNMYHAIHLVEKSGEALSKLMTRDRPFVKLAKFLAASPQPVTQWEMVEELPFYKGSQSQRADLLTLATSWGYKNNVIIKKSFDDGVEVISGESLEETNLDEMSFSYSTDMAFNYVNEVQKFSDLYVLTQSKRGPKDMHHFINHHVDNGHRTEDTCRPGFNFVVLDVDGGIHIDTAKLLLKDYTYLLYTTKSHDPNGEHRFRIILPTNYRLRLDRKEYKEFINELYNDLPFDVDRGTDQRSKKWEANNGHYEYHYGELFDVLPYIPKTTPNEERQKANATLHDLSAVERWFIDRTGEGNRSNQLIKYAMMLVDSGGTFEDIDHAVKQLNNKLPSKLSDDELQTTIMRTVLRKIIKRDQG